MSFVVEGFNAGYFVSNWVPLRRKKTFFKCKVQAYLQIFEQAYFWNIYSAFLTEQVFPEESRDREGFGLNFLSFQGCIFYL